MNGITEEHAAKPKSGLLDTRVTIPGGLQVSFTQMALMAAIVFYSLAIPGDLRYKMTALGFGVCHQISSHSFFIDSHQLPLCARCSGIYLGALSALALLVVLRRRASGLPAGSMVGILALFFTAMVADGVNSTFQNFGGGLWDSTNLIRIFTGGLAGITVAFLLYPMFNLSLWHKEATKRESVLEQPFELLAYMVGAGVLVALVIDGGDWLYYPIAMLSVAGMLTLLTMANTMLVLIVTRRESTYRTLSTALTPILVAVLLSILEVSLLAWGRSSLAPYLANTVGMPLIPGLP